MKGKGRGKLVYCSIQRLTLAAIVFTLLLCLPQLALAGETLEISNVAVTESNTSVITNTQTGVTSVNHQGILFTDTRVYSPQRVFTNMGDVNMTYTGVSGGMAVRGTSSSGTVYYSLMNMANITIDATSQTSVDSGKEHDVRGLTLENSITNYGKVSLSTHGGTATTSSAISANFILENDIRAMSGAGVLNNFSELSVLSYGGTTTVETATDKLVKNVLEVRTMSSDTHINNHGTINSVGYGGTATHITTGTKESITETTVRGIRATGAVVNTGSISVTAYGGTDNNSVQLNNTLAQGISARGNVHNTGKITVNAIAGKYGSASSYSSHLASATGIYMGTNNTTLYSSGLIDVSATDYDGKSTQAHLVRQVHVAASTAVSVTGYAMQFGTQSELDLEYEDVIYGESGSTITFSDTRLFAHITSGFRTNTIYSVPMLVDGHSDAPQFTGVTSMHPDVTATLINNGSSSKQDLQLQYTPRVSAPLMEARTAGLVQSNEHYTVTNAITRAVFASEAPPVNNAGIHGSSHNMVAENSLSVPILTTTHKKNTWFFQPTYQYSEDTSSSGYNSDIYGFTMGYTYQLQEKAYIGAHAGWARSETDYTGSADNQRTLANMYSIGANGMWLIDDEWLLTGLTTFFYGDTDYTDSTPTNKQTANYDSVSFRTDLRFGYLFRYDKHRILPEIGITHTWMHRGKFTTSADNNMPTRYGTLDNHEIYGKLHLRWYNEFMLSDSWKCTPLIGMGVTQVLTDGEVSSMQRLASASQLVTDEEDDTTLTPEMNVTFANDHYYIIAGYNGGYSSNTNNTQFWLQFGVTF